MVEEEEDEEVEEVEEEKEEASHEFVPIKEQYCRAVGTESAAVQAAVPARTFLISFNLLV